MEDLDYIVDTIGRDREKEHQVRLIYNELVNEISETFGFDWIKPQAQDPQVTNQEKGEGMEAGEESKYKPCEEEYSRSQTHLCENPVDTNPTGETETNKHQKTTGKVIWKPQKTGERKHGITKARKRKASSREDESAAILRNQKEIMKRLDKIEREKAQSDYNQSTEERRQKEEEEKDNKEKEKSSDQNNETSPMESVKAMIGATQEFIRQNTDTKVVNEQVKLKTKDKEREQSQVKREKGKNNSETKGEEGREGQIENWNMEIMIDEKLRKEMEEDSDTNHNMENDYEDISENEDMNDDNQEKARVHRREQQNLYPREEEDTRKVREVEEAERITQNTITKSKRARIEMAERSQIKRTFTNEEATKDLRSLLGVKGSNRICTGNCQDTRPHLWCTNCRSEKDQIMEETYTDTWDYGQNNPKEPKMQDEALEWAVKRGKKQEPLRTLQKETTRENYQKKMKRFMKPENPIFRITEGREVDNMFRSFTNNRDHVGREFMYQYYPTVNPIFTKEKKNNMRCCSEIEPVGTLRQHINHSLEDHSHIIRSQVQCLACLSMGREAKFCSPGRLARHVSNVHEKLLMCAHQRAHMSSKSDTWLQAYSQMIVSFCLEKLHLQGYLTNTYYINQSSKPRETSTKN